MAGLLHNVTSRYGDIEKNKLFIIYLLKDNNFEEADISKKQRFFKIFNLQKNQDEIEKYKIKIGEHNKNIIVITNRQGGKIYITSKGKGLSIQFRTTKQNVEQLNGLCNFNNVMIEDIDNED